MSALYLVAPTGVSCTVAVTSKYNPPTSDNISALGLVLHADMDTVGIEIRKEQVFNAVLDIFVIVIVLILSDIYKCVFFLPIGPVVV